MNTFFIKTIRNPQSEIRNPKSAIQRGLRGELKRLNFFSILASRNSSVLVMV